MPSTKKRMLLTISHGLHADLMAWGKVQSIPASTLVTSFLEENRPIFQALTAAVQAQKQGKEKEALKAMSVLTGKALADLGGMMQGKKH